MNKFQWKNRFEKKAPTAAETASAINYYNDSRELTDVENRELSNLSWLIYSNDQTENEKTLVVAVLRAVFNFGFVCGQEQAKEGKE